MLLKITPFIIGALIIGIFVGRASAPHTKQESVKSSSEVEEVRSPGYKFISPLLECEVNKDTYRLMGLNPIQQELDKYIRSQKAAGVIDDAAIYFRDLNNGPWFGVNEHTAFSPASLLKLPVMMAYFKKAEIEPTLLEKKVTYEASDPLLEQEVVPKNQIQSGQTYTIGELINRMMVYSDNAALTLLEDTIEPQLIDKVTLDLGVETATDTTPLDFMSVKGYAGLFRILYNASYLEKQYSEKALETMSKSDFKDGIVASVPENVMVSHKFGERQLAVNSFQLHDCGIIYWPKSPYLLCIMTRGKEYERLSSFIRQASKIVYDGIEKKSNER
jgi:beta-lactamase class A